MMLEKLCDIREDNDLLQKDVANILGVAQQTYSKWEIGEKIIPVIQLNNLCNYFNVSMDYIIGITNVNKPIIYKESFDPIVVGKRLKEIRMKIAMTQQEFARNLNTSQSTISDYESGNNLLLLAFAYEIAIKHKISIDWLYGRI